MVQVCSNTFVFLSMASTEIFGI